MYRFDDKWRQRLLEDALVADLLGGIASPSAQVHRVDTENNASPRRVAGAPANDVRVAKASA